MHYLLFYEAAQGYVDRRAEYRDEHLTLAWQAHARGELVLGGALSDPVDGAMLVFRGSSPAVAEAFAATDPYVRHGLVSNWHVREWSTVVGEGASTPVYPGGDAGPIAAARVDPLLAPIPGAEHREMAGVIQDAARAGAGRVKRVIYQPGFRWATHMQPKVDTASCQHAHVGFIVRGCVRVEFPDGCAREFTAPAPVVIEPGHVGWVVGDEPAVMIEFDFEKQTAARFGLPEVHAHE